MDWKPVLVGWWSAGEAADNAELFSGTLQNPPVGPSDCLLPTQELGGSWGPLEQCAAEFLRLKRCPAAI